MYFGIGAKYQIGESAVLTLDYGQNRSKFGRYMNGNTVYDHERGTADFTVKGHQMGGTPHFWMARLDIGRADIDVPNLGTRSSIINTSLMAHSSVVMVQVLYRIVTSMVSAALHSALGMYRVRIYSLKHSIH